MASAQLPVYASAWTPWWGDYSFIYSPLKSHHWRCQARAWPSSPIMTCSPPTRAPHPWVSVMITHMPCSILPGKGPPSPRPGGRRGQVGGRSCPDQEP